MNNQVTRLEQMKRTFDGYNRMTVLMYEVLKEESELKEFKKCSANRCHPAKCPNYEHC